MEGPITQATGRNNTIVAVFPDRVEVKTGWQFQNVESVGLRDVILPGDMKTILNEVILAQKQSEANLIRRREETAAARSQANTARLLAENPVLARMKELEALQGILEGTKATFVLGSGELGGQLKSLLASTDAASTEEAS